MLISKEDLDILQDILKFLKSQGAWPYHQKLKELIDNSSEDD